MAGASRSIAGVSAKLEQSIREGKYYEALQMYKSLAHRLTGQHKYSEAADLLIAGTRALLQAAQYTAATELSAILFDLFDKTDAPSARALPLTLEFLAAFPEHSEAAKELFIKAALNANEAQRRKAGATGVDPQLSAAVAHSYWRVRDYQRAQQFFLQADSADDYALMLVEWAAAGFDGERDLFIARALLLCLADGRLAPAQRLFEAFVEVFFADESARTPLINFLSLLLRALREQHRPLFDLLRFKYEPSIERDPDFAPLMETIATKFFGTPPAGSAPAAGGMQQLFSSFMQAMMNAPPAAAHSADRSQPQ